MKLFIERDFFDSPTPPTVYLCNTAKKIIGELPAINRKGSFKWNSYSEASFEVPRLYVDMIDGETKIHPFYDKVEAPRNILLKNYGYFCLQDIDDTSNDNEIKSITAFSLEYSASNKYLTNWRINTGEVDSKEVLYNEEVYGIDYNTDTDSFYKLASGAFDPYESYYQQMYTDSNSYIYEQVQIKDENEYQEYLSASNKPNAQPHEKLYIKKFANVQFYNRNKPGLSLLDLIFENIPEWKIGNVDQSLWRKERKFSEDRISVYDFIQNNMAETFDCVAVWDSLTGLVHFYEEVEDDEDENEASTRWETDIFISKDNLSQECKVSYSSDNIKTKLVVTGSDNLDIREVNLGRNEIMNLSFYHSLGWMEQDLFEAYNKYLAALQEAETGLDSSGSPSTNYPMSYPDAMKKWVAANNRWSDLMNAVPAEGNVVLVGDEFKKLYCTFSPINTAYYKNTIGSGTQYVETKDLFLDEAYTKPIPTPTETDMYVVQGALLVYSKTDKRFKVDVSWDSKKFALIKKLNQYHVDEDTNANKQDNILLKLKNSESDVATIRIYDKRTEATSYDERLQYYTKDKDGKYSEENIVFTDATDFNTKKANFAQKGTTIWANDYYVRSVVVRASSGVSEAPDEYPIIDWIKSTLTAQKMVLEGYKITYIGTMGAYFVLAKDETIPDNLQDYGVRLLEEKHKIYTTIFQTQTEAMLSQEKSQCIVQDEEPEGDYVEGTRWLDTNSSPVVLKEYNGKSWITISATVSSTDQASYENYQRYIDNYNKLVAVQQVLSEKEREAEYCLNGYSVPDRVIKVGSSTLQADMKNTALAHLTEIYSNTNITDVQFNSNLPLYIFKTSADTNHTFAVYLKGTQPYVAYDNSQGVYQMIMEYIRDKTEMGKFFTVDQWIRLSPFIKEDEFNDSNFLLTGYESEEERIKICEELMEAAAKELNTLCKPSLEFSMTMANILALPEFKPLFNQFQLGNFIKVQIREGYLKRSRLLEVEINFDDLSDFYCTFGNLITTKSEIDKHADLLSRAVIAGKQVATSAGSWQRAVDKSNAIESEIASGFQNAIIEVGKANGQSISWSENGIMCRKLRDGSTDQYEDAQVAIINNKIVFTNDGWKTSKAVIGEFEVDINGDNNPEKLYGLLADAVVSGYVKGSIIEGGSLKIGGEPGSKGTFFVNEDGEVQILGPNNDSVYASKTKVDEIAQSRQYRTELKYTGSTIFTETNQSCVVECRVFDWDTEITDKLPSGTTFKWVRNSNNTVNDEMWNSQHIFTDTNKITITANDIEKNAQFYCECTIDETRLS